MIWIIAGVMALIAYLLGSVNSSIIISKMISGKDIRSEGSGNAGATNMLRTHGKKAGILTLICDMLKGVIAILIARLVVWFISVLGLPADYIAGSSMVAPTVFGKSISTFEADYLLGWIPYVAALFAVLGHNFPVFFGFKGGKGVATSGAVILMLDWKIGLIVLVFAIAVMAVTRYVSLGSVLSAAAYPIALVAFMLGRGEFDFGYFLFSIIISGLLIFRHRANIVRLKNGTENKLGAKKKKEDINQDEITDTNSDN